MKPALALALAAVALPALAQAPKWTTFTAKADSFSVLMPVAAPKLTTQNMQGVTTHIYIAQGGSLVCIASKSNLPAGFGKANVDAMTKAMRDSMLQTSGATATGDHKTVHAGLTGDQTDFKTPVGGTGLMWVAHAPRAVFSLTIAKQTPLSPAEAKRFLDSFRFK